MNLRELDYICAVAKLGHFGKAAVYCGVSQPTLSGQIKKLETELGVAIFERDNKQVRVTQIGQAIIDQASVVRQGVAGIKDTAKRLQDPLSGRLRLGLIPTIAPYLIPLFSRQISAAFPNLSVSYYEDVTDRLNEGLAEGEIDVAIMATQPISDRLEIMPLYKEPFWSVVPAGHRLSEFKTIVSADLPAEELLLLSEGHCFRDQALDICHRSPAGQGGEGRARSGVWATSLETLINMVAAKQGVTLVPALALGGQWASEPSLVTCQIAESGAMRTVNLTYRKSFPRQILVKALARVILQSVPNTVSPLTLS